MSTKTAEEEFNELLNWVRNNPDAATHEIRGLRMQLDYITNGVISKLGNGFNQPIKENDTPIQSFRVTTEKRKEYKNLI